MGEDNCVHPKTRESYSLEGKLQPRATFADLPAALVSFSQACGMGAHSFKSPSRLSLWFLGKLLGWPTSIGHIPVGPALSPKLRVNCGLNFRTFQMCSTNCRIYSQ